MVSLILFVLISLIIYNMKCTSVLSRQMMDWQLQGKEGPLTYNQIKTIHRGKKNNTFVIYIYLLNNCTNNITLLHCWGIFHECAAVLFEIFIHTALYYKCTYSVAQHIIQQNRTLKTSSQTRCYCVCAWIIWLFFHLVQIVVSVTSKVLCVWNSVLSSTIKWVFF